MHVCVGAATSYLCLLSALLSLSLSRSRSLRLSPFLSAVPLSLHGDYYSSHRLSADTQILLSSPVNHLELREREKEREDERHIERNERIQGGMNERKQWGNWGKKEGWEVKCRNRGERESENAAVRGRSSAGSVTLNTYAALRDLYPAEKRQSNAHIHLSFSCHWAGDVQEIVNDVCVNLSVSPVLHKLTLVSLPPACINNCQCSLQLHTHTYVWVKLFSTGQAYGWILNYGKLSLCVCTILRSALRSLFVNAGMVYCKALLLQKDTLLFRGCSFMTWDKRKFNNNNKKNNNSVLLQIHMTFLSFKTDLTRKCSQCTNSYKITTL